MKRQIRVRSSAAFVTLSLVAATLLTSCSDPPAEENKAVVPQPSGIRSPESDAAAIGDQQNRGMPKRPAAKTHTVEALLEVTYASPDLTVAPKERGREFEVFRNTQVAGLQSTVVINHALSRSSISPRLKSETSGNPLAWITNRLKVDVLNDSELIRLRITAESSPDFLVDVLNEIINGYQKEILFRSFARKAERRDELGKTIQQLQKDYDEKIEVLQAMRKREDASESILLGIEEELTRDKELLRALTLEAGLFDANEKVGADRVRVFQSAELVD